MGTTQDAHRARSEAKHLWPIGTLVTLRLLDGTTEQTETVTRPHLFNGVTWGVWVRGYLFPFALDHLESREWQGDPHVG